MIVSKNKVAIIIPYYGKWPSFFKLFLKGCEYNTWVDIIFFTDCIPPQLSASNIIFIPSSPQDFSDRVNKKLGLHTSFELKDPYKLCDFKTTYGVLFEEVLNNYAYWGYGDIDLIYGSLEKYVRPLIDEAYDVISMRGEILSGSMVLLKNNEKINNLFRLSNDFETVLTSNKHFSFSETNFSTIAWQGQSKLNLRTPIESMTYVVARENESGAIKAHFGTLIKEKILPGELIHFKSGQVWVNDEREVAFYHFICEKSDPYYRYPTWQLIPDDFYISKTGFYTQHEYKFYDFMSLLRKVRLYPPFVLKKIKSKLNKI